MELLAGRPPGAQVLLPRREPPPSKLPGWTAGGSSSSSGSKARSRFHQGVTAPAVLCTLRFYRRSCRQRWRGRTVAYNFPPGLELDTSIDIPDRPEKRMVKELSRYEDPDDPIRPQAPPRDRKGLWAPPGPQAIAAPEVLVVGLGRRLRADEEDGPRARLGAGAVEALQRRYQVRTHFDADVQGYMATCRASLDKSGRAGVQKIHLMQPLVAHDTDDIRLILLHVSAACAWASAVGAALGRLQAFAQSRRERLHASLQDEANALFKEVSAEKFNEPGTAEDVHPQCLKDFDRCTYQIGSCNYQPGQAADSGDIANARQSFAKRLSEECSCSAAGVRVISALCSQISMAHLATVSFSGPHAYALPGGFTKARIHLRRKSEESSDLILGIERAARGFESFSLPEDGQVHDCHKTSSIQESAEVQFRCSSEGVLVDVLDVREAITLCFPDERVVVHDGLPLHFRSPPAGESFLRLLGGCLVRWANALGFLRMLQPKRKRA
ncbi:unnamed protein product [Symbiodinium sp. CCMP2592]|nr:unnamed protein product [Symbiodinium sp. CCMP2592]